MSGRRYHKDRPQPRLSVGREHRAAVDAPVAAVDIAGSLREHERRDRCDLFRLATAIDRDSRPLVLQEPFDSLVDAGSTLPGQLLHMASVIGVSTKAGEITLISTPLDEYALLKLLARVITPALHEL